MTLVSAITAAAQNVKLRQTCITSHRDAEEGSE